MQKFFENKKIIVTGATGFLGSTFLDEINSGLLDITVLSRDNKNEFLKKHKNIKIFKGDLSNPNLWEDLIEGADYIFHLAGLEYDKKNFNQTQDFNLNFMCVVNLLEASRKLLKPPKIIFTSSGNIEKDDPKSIWSLHKFLAEKYLNYFNRNSSVKTLCLRLPNLFGEPRNIKKISNSSLNKMIADVVEFQSIYLYKNSKCERNFLHVTDAARSLIYAAKFIDKLHDNNYYYVGSDESSCYDEISKFLFQIAKKYQNINLSKILIKDNLDSFEMRSFRNDCSIFSLITGYKPTISLKDGIENTFLKFSNIKGQI